MGKLRSPEECQLATTNLRSLAGQNLFTGTGPEFSLTNSDPGRISHQIEAVQPVFTDIKLTVPGDDQERRLTLDLSNFENRRAFDQFELDRLEIGVDGTNGALLIQTQVGARSEQYLCKAAGLGAELVALSHLRAE